MTAARLLPFRGRGLEVAEVGDPARPAIAYLHGILGNREEDVFLASLAAATECRVIAPSLPGFGLSDAADDLCSYFDWVVAASEIVTLCGIAGIPVVAASVGAMLALDVAAIRPEAFASLTAISPLGLWCDEDPVADLFAMPIGEQRMALLARPEAGARFFEDPELADRDSLVERSVLRYRARQAAASLVWPIPEHGIDRRIHLIKCSVGLVWGDRDMINPPSYLSRWEVLLPDHVGSVQIEDAGHCAEWDQPERVAAGVASILSR